MKTAIRNRRKGTAPGKPTKLAPRANGQPQSITVGTMVQFWNKTGGRVLFEGLVERIDGDRALVAAAGANQIKKSIPLEELEVI